MVCFPLMSAIALCAGLTIADVTFTANAEDCCSYCQGLEDCVGGSWETGPNADFPGRCFVVCPQSLITKFLTQSGLARCD